MPERRAVRVAFQDPDVSVNPSLTRSGSAGANPVESAYPTNVSAPPEPGPEVIALPSRSSAAALAPNGVPAVAITSAFRTRRE